MTTINELIHPGLISVAVQATDRREAIDELAELFERDGRLNDRAVYVDAVWDREEETGGTGMESGIAIPHAKSPAVAQASLAFGKSAHGVDFGTEDGTKADLIFLIAAPEGADDLHVRLLSRLARRLIHESFRTALREATTADDVMAVISREVEL